MLSMLRVQAIASVLDDLGRGDELFALHRLDAEVRRIPPRSSAPDGPLALYQDMALLDEALDSRRPPADEEQPLLPRLQQMLVVALRPG
jgi:hypothetical protein